MPRRAATAETVEPAERSAASTVIELCGELAVRIGGRDIDGLPGRQGRMLFAYLVLNRDRPVSRDQLIDVLWPRDAPADPDAAFASVLARVRQVVGRDVVHGRSELVLRLEPGARVDVESARELTELAKVLLGEHDARGAWDAAVRARRIVGRPLLAGLTGDWVEKARTELADLEPQLLEVMAEAALLDDALDGLAAARTLIDRHPFRESGYEALMRLQARHGDVAEALTTFHRLQSLLDEELGTVPSKRLIELHDRLLRDGEPEARPGAQVPLQTISTALGRQPFVGRGDCLSGLQRAWRASLAGQRRLALLLGEAGVGKTRAAAEFAARVHEEGATVLYGRCDEEPIHSYQPFVEALRHYLRHAGWLTDPQARPDLDELARLVPEARAGGAAPRPPALEGDSDRYRLFTAVLAVLDRAAAERPLLLVLDDIQWADKPTLLMLRHIVRDPSPVRLLVVGGFRHLELGGPHPLRDLVADVRRDRRLERIELKGLGDGEAEQLIAQRLATAASPGFVHGLRERTDGNPFFIEESLRALAESHAVGRGAVADEAALRAMGVPAGVADVIVRRLARVSQATRDALVVGAVIGREFDLGPVQAVTGLDADAAIEAMEEAIAFGLVVEARADRFAFSHALVREAIYGRLSDSRRRRLHLRAGLALEHGAGREPAGAAELAHHFYIARDLGEAGRAVRRSLQAGREAALACAYEDAVEHYRRALEALDPHASDHEDRRCEVLLALGRAQWQAGEAGARDTYMEVVRSARARGAAEQLARAALGLGERYWEAFMVDEEYVRLIDGALAGLDRRDSTLRVRLMARLGENLHFTADQERGAELCREALAMARRLGDRPTTVKALMAGHVALLHTADLAERRAVIDEVLELAGDQPGLAAEAHHWRIYDLCESGEIAAARDELSALEGLAADLGQPLLHYLATGWRGVFAQLEGRVADTERLAQESYEIGTQAHAGDARSTYVARIMTLRRQQGRIAELVPDIRAVARVTPAWAVALALAELETGDSERGRARFERVLAGDRVQVPRDWYWLAALAQLAETSWALGDAGRAALLYAELAPYAERTVQLSIMVCWGSVHRYLGLLAATTGRLDTAARHFEAALARNRGYGAVLMEAETQVAYAALLRRRDAPGDQSRAGGLAAAAEAVAEERGLAGLRGRAAALRGG